MCSFTCSMSVGIKGSSDPYIRTLGWALLVTFMAYVVSLGGLGAIQDECDAEGEPINLAGIWGFSPTINGCKRVYRFYWFILAWQFVALVIAGGVLFLGGVKKSRALVVAFLSIATLLYMKTCDSFLTMRNFGKWQEGYSKDRINAMVAGCVMTAALDCVLILLFGYDASLEAPEAKQQSEVAVAVDN